MFSFLGKLFGTDKAGEAIVDGATSAIDKIWYTEEEKAEDAAQAKREAAAVYMKWLESTSGSRLARRMIAFMVTAPLPGTSKIPLAGMSTQMSIANPET